MSGVGIFLGDGATSWFFHGSLLFSITELLFNPA